MPKGALGICLYGVLALWLSAGVAAEARQQGSLAERIAAVERDLLTEPPDPSADSTGTVLEPGLGVTVRGCDSYPYSEQRDAGAGPRRLLEDLAEGLTVGLQCLAGAGPAGRLHSFHEYQAHRLLSVLESDRTKTFRCVADEMFATAVATGPGSINPGDPLYPQLRKTPFPGVVFDTFRLGGILSLKHDDATYRRFFHLRDDQILEHRSGQPLRPANLHRYQNRPALVFHELVHWLGHEHSAIRPDLATLYEACCFGGSDYISDDDRNRLHQARACSILQDDDLWSQGYSPYRQMRIWHFKGYSDFKGAMRADFDS